LLVYSLIRQLYITVDGGESWKKIFDTYLGKHVYDFSKVSFIDSLQGWAASYGGQIFHTVDGGFTWEFQDSTALEYIIPLRDIQFTTADSGWAVGGIAGTSIILRTSDGGENWSSYVSPRSITPPDTLPLTIASLKEIRMLNSKTGWIVGSINGPAYIMKTTDGGVTWKDETPKNEDKYFQGFESISMLDSQHGFIVGSDGRLYETTDGGEITEVVNNPIVNGDFSLSQNYPNPFNPTTKIKYNVPLIAKSKMSNVKLTVYDVLGRKISTLVNGIKQPGNYEVNFNADGLSSGIYYYELKSGNYVSTKKMIFMK